MVRVTRIAETVRGAEMMVQSCAKPMSAALKISAQSGSSTIAPRYRTVVPSASPNPGMTLRWRTEVVRKSGRAGPARRKLACAEQLVQLGVGVEVFLVDLVPAAELVLDL